MKKLSLYLFFLSFSFSAAAQECSKMYDYFKEGVQLEYTNYDKKGKVSSTNTQKITRLENSADTLIAIIDMSGVDEKGKETFKNSSFPLKCYKGTIYMDLRSLVPPQQNSKQSADMQIEISGSDLMFPPDMKTGQALPDAEMGIKMSLGSLNLMNTKYYIKNRKVEGEETITVPAGTYKCMKISYDFEYKLMGTRTIHTMYWYSPSVGMVRSISYDKKGNEDSKTELTKFVK